MVVLELPSLLPCKEILIIAGNFSFNGGLANLAQYDYTSGKWLHSYEPGLYLYGASNGVVLDMVTNFSGRSFLVGAFDSDSKTSQVAYCSVGEWNGYNFAKVGEGLCPLGIKSAKATYIRSIVLDSAGSIIVGGNFHARVWNGGANSFSDAYDLAIYRDKIGWLPLAVNSNFGCMSCSGKAGVYALAWDASSDTLYIGGIFDSMSSQPISSALCQWNSETGIQNFDGGSFSNDSSNSSCAQIVALAFHRESKVRYLLLVSFASCDLYIFHNS